MKYALMRRFCVADRRRKQRCKATFGRALGVEIAHAFAHD